MTGSQQRRVYPIFIIERSQESAEQSHRDPVAPVVPAQEQQGQQAGQVEGKLEGHLEGQKELDQEQAKGEQAQDQRQQEQQQHTPLAPTRRRRTTSASLCSSRAQALNIPIFLEAARQIAPHAAPASPLVSGSSVGAPLPAPDHPLAQTNEPSSPSTNLAALASAKSSGSAPEVLQPMLGSGRGGGGGGGWGSVGFTSTGPANPATGQVGGPGSTTTFSGPGPSLNNTQDGVQGVPQQQGQQQGQGQAQGGGANGPLDSITLGQLRSLVSFQKPKVSSIE